MGAAAATAKQPLAEVDIKNEIGVLYGEEAQQAFAAAKEEDDVVAWPKVQAYAEAHGLLDPKSVLFKNLRQFKKARDLLERALVIKEREYGCDHREVAMTLDNLGNAHGALGDAAKSRDLLERALAIFERAFGRDHPHAARCREKLGR